MFEIALRLKPGNSKWEALLPEGADPSLVLVDKRLNIFYSPGSGWSEAELQKW
jgi:hypothetical protein